MSCLRSIRGAAEVVGAVLVTVQVVSVVLVIEVSHWWSRCWSVVLAVAVVGAPAAPR